MNDYPELQFAFDDMQKQADIYQPTAFWMEASQKIAEEVHLLGVERFRSFSSSLGFFVPTYGSPGNSFSRTQIDEHKRLLCRSHPDAKKAQQALDMFLSGELAALADYRVLLAADDTTKLPSLHLFSESEVGQPSEHFIFDDRRFSRSSLNYLLGLAWFKKRCEGDLPRTVLEIGGGFGTLGEVLSRASIEGLRYINIDIPPTSFMAEYYLREVLGKDKVMTYSQTRNQISIEIESLPEASVLCTWQIERLHGEVDLFVNFISFQEMEPHVVKNYLSHVTRLGARWVLMRNMREGKQLRKVGSSVGVNVPIRSGDYLEMLPGYSLVERNVFPFGYRTVDGYHSELLLLRRKV